MSVCIVTLRAHACAGTQQRPPESWLSLPSSLTQVSQLALPPPPPSPPSPPGISLRSPPHPPASESLLHQLERPWDWPLLPNAPSRPSPTPQPPPPPPLFSLVWATSSSPHPSFVLRGLLAAVCRSRPLVLSADGPRGRLQATGGQTRHVSRAAALTQTNQTSFILPRSRVWEMLNCFPFKILSDDMAPLALAADSSV